MLTEKANFRKNNVNNCVFSTDGFSTQVTELYTLRDNQSKFHILLRFRAVSAKLCDFWFQKIIKK